MDEISNHAGNYFAPGHDAEYQRRDPEYQRRDPEYQRRLTIFNLARGLFPYTSIPDAPAVVADEVIKAAEKIEAFLTGVTEGETA